MVTWLNVSMTTEANVYITISASSVAMATVLNVFLIAEISVAVK